jgi:hypothetical protein
MSLLFKAYRAECISALDGDILMVTLDSRVGIDEEEPSTPYIQISRNVEVPGPPAVEWFDGADYFGGEDVVRVVVARRAVVFQMKKSGVLKAELNLTDRDYSQLVSTLRGILDRDLLFES